MEMECTWLNLLIGTNSSGKSSVLQGLLLVAQNMEQECRLNGTLVSLGTFAESRCLYEEKKDIKIFVWNENSGICLRFGLEDNGESLLNYKSESKNSDQAFLNQYRSDVIESGFCKGNLNYTLLGQVNWWLSYIADTEINTEEILGADLVKANYTMYDAVQIRPINVVSGISYLISVLIVCLLSPKESVIVIENPEIHLHPSAQAKLCEFLYFVSKNQCQLFIESHGDHVFNGFRAGIALGEMKREEINIQFISLDKEHTSQAMRVQIGRMGRIEN